MSYDLAVPLLGIYPEKDQFEKIQVPQCLQQYYLQQTRKQPKRPSTDKWIKKIKKMCYVIYLIEYYSARKKNEIMPFAALALEWA